MAQLDMAQIPIFLPEALLSLLLCFFLLLLSHYYFARRSPSNCKQRDDHGLRLPPSPPKLPLIGHLHLIGRDPHISLTALARKHAVPDGLMLLHLGEVPNVVVSSPRAAEAVLRTHDHVFASRSSSTVTDVLLSGPSNIGLAPYGEYWRKVRKLVTTHMLSASKVRAFQGAREEEVHLVVAKIRAAATQRATVDMTELLAAFANDVVCRAVSGKFFREGGRTKLFRELLAGNAAVLSGFNLEDCFPSLAKVGLFRRLALAKTSGLKKKWDELLDKIIDDHATKPPSQEHDEQEQQDQVGRDLVDVLLSLQHEYNLTRDNVRAILMDMFAAGTDSSSIVLEFAMAELIRKPHLMAKLQAEVRGKTPKAQETVKEDDLSGMAYLKAVVKETLRLHPPGPLLLPHLSTAKCDDVNGYGIPAGTRVIINAWALGRDEGSWGVKADEFWPERFVDGDTAAADFWGRDFQFLPFGAGRRMCPGMSFGMATVELMLANLAHCFDWELPHGMREEDVDMAEVFGVTVHRKEKLILVPKIPQDASSACCA